MRLENPEQTTVRRRSVLGTLAAGTGGLFALGGTAGQAVAMDEPSVPFPPQTEITMHPSPFSSMLSQLGNSPDAWKTVRRTIDGIEWHMHPTFHDFTTPAAERFASVLKRSGIPQGVEVIGPAWHDEPWDDGLSDRAVERVSGFLNDMEAAGCDIDYINIDGPYKTMVRGTRPELEDRGFETYERAADELVDFVVGMRDERPNLSVRVIPNFPNWRWKGDPSITGAEWGDYDEAFHVMVDAFEDQHERIEAVMVDHPAEYGGKDRIPELRDEAYDRNLDFWMIANSETGGGTSDAEFTSRTYDYIADLQRMGLDPDGYNIESWYPHPQQNVPESDETTMAGLVREVLDFRDRAPGAQSDPASIVSFYDETVLPGETRLFDVGIETAARKPVSGTVRVEFPDGWDGTIERPFSFSAGGADPYRQQTVSVETTVPEDVDTSQVRASLLVDGAEVDAVSATISVQLHKYTWEFDDPAEVEDWNHNPNNIADIRVAEDGALRMHTTGFDPYFYIDPSAMPDLPADVDLTLRFRAAAERGGQGQVYSFVGSPLQPIHEGRWEAPSDGDWSVFDVDLNAASEDLRLVRIDPPWDGTPGAVAFDWIELQLRV